MLEQSTLLSGFQTYVTATSSSDDIYYKRRPENVISDVGREKWKELENVCLDVDREGLIAGWSGFGDSESCLF